MEYTVKRVQNIMENVTYCKSTHVELRNLVCCRATIFYPQSGGEQLVALATKDSHVFCD